MNPDDASFRQYGPRPYQLVLVHGGPGAAGYLTPIAIELSAFIGVIDAYQTRDKIEGLINELHTLISTHAIKPIVLLGHSWGAWLSLLFASSYPGLVMKTILVASAPFKDHYVPGIMETRMERMNEMERDRFSQQLKLLELPGNDIKGAAFREIADILKKTDAYDPSVDKYEQACLDYNLYKSIWQEAEQMRTSGELLNLAGKVRCPVLAIHGDYDPHPADGVKTPLNGIVQDFRFVLLDKCGHEPWTEKHAKNKFYTLLKKELLTD